jgi:tetratricopeptide (TPR) repeat protein
MDAKNLNVRNAAFSNVSCADEARQILDLWENALRMRSQILSIFSLDSVNLKKLTQSLTATPGQLPILYEAEAKYLIGRYYLSRLNDPIEAIVWLDESVSLYKAYDRNRSITPDSNLENYFKACLDLGVAYSQISKFGESSSAFNLAYRIARRTNNQEWLQYYQKIIRAITDRMD